MAAVSALTLSNRYAHARLLEIPYSPANKFPMNDRQAQIDVVHSAHVWLTQTMTWLHTQIRCLPSGIESHIVCDRVANEDQFPSRNLIAAERDPWIWRALSARAWPIARHRQSYLIGRTIRRTEATVLHSHFGDRGWANIDVARRHGVKHVVTFYGYDVSQLPQVEERWRKRYLALFDSADLFLCEGPHLGRCLVELGCPSNKVQVHHLGIDLSRVRFHPRVWAPGQVLRVLIAGTFLEKKGFPTAIAALGRIRRKVPLEVLIIGDAVAQQRSKEEKARIIEAIFQAGLSGCTKLLGYQPYTVLLDTALSCHVFLSPSVTASDGDTEGGAPVSVIEMAASGMPVVSTTHCDIPEVLEDGTTGLLAGERDVDGLEVKLSWLIDHPDLWTPMVTAARRHIEYEFDAEIQGAKLGKLYRTHLIPN